MRTRRPAEIEGYIPIGQIVGAFGLKGELKVEPLTNIESRFSRGKLLRVEDKGDARIESVRFHKGRFLLKLDGFDSIEAAEAVQWKHIYVPEDDVPELEEGEYLVEDLIGLRVRTVDGREIGKVDDVLPYPAHDILVVGSIMIPAVPEFVEMIDFDDEVITVRLLEGMEDA